MTDLSIGGLEIGRGQRPVIVAELSANHGGSLARALEITEAAARAGAQALKLQTFTADTLTLDASAPEFRLDHPESPWKGQTLHALYAEAHTPWEWHAPLFARARELGMVCFSSPFDETAVDFLEALGAPAYKIASFENVHLPLIRKCASTGKPLILSTGMASIAELSEAVATAREAGCKQLVLLKCTSAYPAPARGANLRTLPHMRELFACEVGLSDHTLGIGVALAAIAHGATLIEKHLTLRRSDGGLDAAFSLEPEELACLVRESVNAWESLGEIRYGAAREEESSLQERRSLYVSRDVRAGEVLTPQNLRCIRPGFGLAPRYYSIVLGRRVTRDLKKGTPLDWDCVLG